MIKRDGIPIGTVDQSMRDDIRHFKLRLDKYGFLRGRDEEDQDLDFGDFVENEESIDTQQLDISSLGSGTTKPGTKNRSKPEKSTKSADADESSGSDNEKEPKKTKKASKKAYKIKSAEIVNSSEDESEQGDVLKDKPSTSDTPPNQPAPPTPGTSDTSINQPAPPARSKQDIATKMQMGPMVTTRGRQSPSAIGGPRPARGRGREEPLRKRAV